MQARFPKVNQEACTGCGECTQVCREEAIGLSAGVAGIDPVRCLSCGVCLRTCPEGALSPQSEGYRVQIGGKLGRHPRLADELPGIQAREQVLNILNHCLQWHQKDYQPGRRFGELVAEHGLKPLQDMMKSTGRLTKS